jgi:hypothetical protein
MAGKPGITMPCGWCKKPLTARLARSHFTDCPKRPKQIKAAQKRLRKLNEARTER